MSTLGSSRERLASLLNSAFAEGLLSEQTHSYRLGLLFGSRLIDRQLLVGDLFLRRRHTQPAAALRTAWSAILESIRPLAPPGTAVGPALMLVLDDPPGERLLLGRHPGCDVVLLEPSVSRRHALLTLRDGVWVLRDLASTNGTLLNGIRVGRTSVRSGDILTLGAQQIQIG